MIKNLFPNKLISIILLMLGSLIFLISECVSMGVEIRWMEGFPMRAGSQVVLMWIPYPGIENYTVVRKNTNTGEVLRRNVKGTQYLDTVASLGDSYEYFVESFSPTGRSPVVSDKKLIQGKVVIEPPKWGGHYVENNTINLVWENRIGAVFYNLYRAVEGANFSLISSVREARYSDVNVQPGNKYVYKVHVVGMDSQESGPSSELKVEFLGSDISPKMNSEESSKIMQLQLSRVVAGIGDFFLKEPTDMAVVDGELFVTDLGSRSILSINEDNEVVVRFGSMPAEYPGAWGIPWGIDISPDGEFVAASFLQSSNVRIFTRKGDMVVDISILKPLGYEEFLENPQPMDVAMDAEGGFWVTDYTYGQVIHLDSNGKEILRVGIPRQAEDGGGPFRSPTFISIDRLSRKIYVADSLLASIFVIDREGKILDRWDGKEDDSLNLSLPKGICVQDGVGLFVVDGMQSSLQRFSLDNGKPFEQFYTKDKEFLDVRSPVAVAVDPENGDLYILSKVENAIHHYTQE